MSSSLNSNLYYGVRDRNGMPIRRQREVCLRPQVSLVYSLTVYRSSSRSPLQNQNPQRLELTRQEVFGPHLQKDPTRNEPPNDMVYLKISDLRSEATTALQLMNLTPA